MINDEVNILKMTSLALCILMQAAKLVRSGKEVLIVTSGAVGVGRQRLRRQALLRQSMSDLISQKEYVHNFS